jgi:hypothetical protein
MYKKSAHAPLVAMNTSAWCDKNGGRRGCVAGFVGDGGGEIEGWVATYPLCDRKVVYNSMDICHEY